MSATPAAPRTLLGVAAALGAGLMWGLVFVAPQQLGDYSAWQLTLGRYAAFGVVVLPLALMQWQALRRLARADWLAALRLSLIGNFLYYTLLATAIGLAGVPVPSLMIGTLPVVIPLAANWLQGRGGQARLPWRRLALPLGAIALGLACVQTDQWQRLAALASSTQARWHLLAGAAVAVGAVWAWTWYPIRNAQWLQQHPQHRAVTWATAQGLVTLPLAVLGFAGVWGVTALLSGPSAAGALLAGPRPEHYLLWMLALGVLASWLGTLLWNIASQNTPTTLTGQLIVFETLSALTYAYALAGRWPSLLEAVGIGLLIAGVLTGVRAVRVRAVTGPKESSRA
ncbi:DMT family transporter [Amphibiibacter pelophylacis]|uniref:DMT family transporter n=1 Tax=Amphibiibacter pelophylacis TaxID=1799477 RepID=A0ACC6P3S5_9BURK